MEALVQAEREQEEKEMTLIFIRIFFIILSIIVGFQVGSFVQGGEMDFALIGAGIGFIVAMSINPFFMRYLFNSFSRSLKGLMLFLLFTKSSIEIPIKTVPFSPEISNALSISIL